MKEPIIPPIAMLQDGEGRWHVQSMLTPVKTIQIVAQILASMTKALQDMQDIPLSNN